MRTISFRIRFDTSRLGMVALAGIIALAVAGSGGSIAVQAQPTNPGPTGPGREGGADTQPPVARPEATCPGVPAQCFTDVPPGNPFFNEVNNLYLDGVISGYACGSPGETCDSFSRPYYRPLNNVVRQQMAKFIDLGRRNIRTAVGQSLNLTNTLVVSGTTVLTGSLNLTGVGDVYTDSDYFALRAWNDAPAGKGLFGVTEGNGTAETFAGITAGSYAWSGGATNSTGLYAFALDRAGARIYTQDPSSVYGLLVEAGGIKVGTANAATNSVYIYGPLTVTGAKTGYVVDIMRNTGTTDLHTGDIAVLSSTAAGPAQLGDIPVPNVQAAGEAYGTGVVGVVDMRWVPADPSAPGDSRASTGYYDAQATVIKPGEYMGVVTLGSYKGVKVDATYGPIKVGDLLVSSVTTGHAMKSTDKVSSIGAVIGKALGPLDSGTGTIPVLVTLK